MNDEQRQDALRGYVEKAAKRTRLALKDAAEAVREAREEQERALAFMNELRPEGAEREEYYELAREFCAWWRVYGEQVLTLRARDWSELEDELKSCEEDGTAFLGCDVEQLAVLDGSESSAYALRIPPYAWTGSNFYTVDELLTDAAARERLRDDYKKRAARLAEYEASLVERGGAVRASARLASARYEVAKYRQRMAEARLAAIVEFAVYDAQRVEREKRLEAWQPHTMAAAILEAAD